MILTTNFSTENILKTEYYFITIAKQTSPIDSNV